MKITVKLDMHWLSHWPMRVLLLGASAFVAAGDAQSADPQPTAPTQPVLGVSAVVPADAPYVPLTRSQRWQLYVAQTYLTPGAYFRTFAVAADQDFNARPHEWGQGLIGYSQRAGSNFARFVLFDTYEATAAEALGHEVRYMRCRCSGFLPRFDYALGTVFVTRNREGHIVPHYARLPYEEDAPSIVSHLLLTRRLRDLRQHVQQIRAMNRLRQV